VTIVKNNITNYFHQIILIPKIKGIDTASAMILFEKVSIMKKEE